MKLFDNNKKVIGDLQEYKNIKIELFLESDKQSLSFYIRKNNELYTNILEEGYIEAYGQEYVIKSKIPANDEYYLVECQLNLEELEGAIFSRFDNERKTIDETMDLLLSNTGWTFKKTGLKKLRKILKIDSNGLEIINKIAEVYNVQLNFDTLQKNITIRDTQDRGIYNFNEINTKRIGDNSYNYATRLIPVGINGLNISEINSKKNYIENHEYSNKIKTIYWKDTNYSDANDLKEDAEKRLAQLSRPRHTYIVKLDELSKKSINQIQDYNVGDKLTSSDNLNKTEILTIIRLINYPENIENNLAVVSNCTLNFPSQEDKLKEVVNLMNNAILDDGTINGKAINQIEVNQIQNFEQEVSEAAKVKKILSQIDEINLNKVNISDLNATKAQIENLKVTGSATINKLEATETDIKNLKANKADFQSLNAVEEKVNKAIIGKADVSELNVAVEKVGILEGKTASFETVLAGNLTGKNFHANAITAGSGIIAEGAIGDAEISSLSGNKLNFGEIDTSKVTICGAKGRFRIIGDKLQVLDDRNGKLYERIMLGVDDNNKSTLALRGKDGQTTLIDENGLTDAGFTNGYGKVNDNSLDASKFDKNSIVRQVNGSTETIKGTKVTVGDRTLDVELSTQKNTVKEQGKELSNQKAIIQALDDAIKLKVDNQTFKESTNSINASIINAKNSAVTEANKHSDTLATKLKSDAEKYANDVAIAKSELAKQQAIANADGKISAEEQKRVDEAKKNLDTAIAKATEAENKAKKYADEVAEQKKQDAIKTANTYTTAQITTTNSNLSKATSEINVLKGQIGTKVGQTDIDKAISNITIGGRNLYKGTRDFNSKYWSVKLPLENYENDDNFKQATITNDYSNLMTTTKAQGFDFSDTSKEWTISAYFKGDTEGQTIGITLNGNKIGWRQLPVVKGKWNKLIWTFKGDGQSLFSFRFENPNLQGVLKVAQVKVEQGNKATGYTEAPEDLNQAIIDSAKKTDERINTVETELKQTKESFGVSVRDLNSKTSTIETNITNTSNNLSTKINTAKTDAINSALNSARNEINSAKAYAEKVAKDNSNLAKQQAINDSKSYTNGQIGAVNTNINNVKNTTDLLSKGLNKWIFKAFDKGSLNNSQSPDIGMILNKNLLWNKEISDSEMNSYKDFGSNYIGYCKTNVYLDSAYTWNTTLRTDDAGTLYLNGNLIDKTVSCSAKNVSLQFKQGWNTIEVLWVEVAGGDGFNFGSNISSLSQIKVMNAYNVADSKAEIGYLNTDISNKYNSSVAHANTIAEQKKNEAVSSANSHADSVSTTKANAAQSAAISHADSVATTKANDAKNQAINSANSYTNTAKQQAIDSANNHANSIAEQKKNEAINQANKDTDTKINNLEIGGRNIIRASSIKNNSSTGSFDATTNTWNIAVANGAGGSWGGGLVITGNKTLIPYGKTYVLSFEIKVPVACSINADVNCFPITGSAWSGNDNDNTSKRKTSSYSLQPNKWIKCWLSYENTDSRNTKFVDIYDNTNFGVVNNTGSTINYQIRNVKGELGNKPTDWTPAPEDVELNIDTAKQQAIKESAAKATEAENKAKKYADEVAVAKANLAQTMAQSYADGKVSTEEKARIKQAQDNLNTAVAKATAAKNEAITQAEKTAEAKANLAKAYADDVANKKAELAKQQAIANADGKISEEEKKRIKQATDNLNTAIAKASAAETNARNYANQVSEQKKNEAITGARNIPDTRNDNQPPKWYMGNYCRQTITEFKLAKTLGIPVSDNPYGTVETKVPWGDASGGYPVQTFRSSSTATYQRKGINQDSWSSWEQIEDTKGSQSKADTAKNNAINSANGYTNTQISTVNSKVSNVQSSLNVLKNEINSKVSQSNIDKTVTNINNQIKLANEKISTAESSFTQKTNSINSKVSQIESTTNSLNGKITSNTNRISTAESKLTPNAIVNSVNSSIGSGGSIKGASTILDNNKFTVKDTDNSRVELEKGCITAFNSSNKKTYYMDENSIGICAKDNSDPLGMVTSVYKNNLNDGISLVTPGGSIKGMGLFAGDYAKYLTLGHDTVWGDDSKYEEYLTFNKKGWGHLYTGFDFHHNELVGVKNLNYQKNDAIFMAENFYYQNQINSSRYDKTIWLNYNVGNCVRIGNGNNKGGHGKLVLDDLWVHGNKHKIIDCGDLGFIGMEAYETATPYFGDIGYGITNEDGECYIAFDREFMEVCNTSIEYMVVVQEEGETKDSWAKPCRKKANGFMVKGSPKTKFSYEVKAIQKGFEKNRFKRVDEERGLKTDFTINDSIRKEIEDKGLKKGETIMDDLEFNRALRYKSILKDSKSNKALEMINELEGVRR